MNLLPAALFIAQAGAVRGPDEASSSQVIAETATIPKSSIAREVASPPGLPTIGKWMLDGKLEVASWLGKKVRGKQVREPINVIVLDPFAASPEQATRRLVDGLRAAGYKIVAGHSSGYRAIIGGSLVPQLPSGKTEAFADAPPDRASDHGRMFGPFPLEHGFLFSGAFSLEVVSHHIAGHLYGSFNHARDDLATRLDEGAAYHVTGYVSLDNAIVGDPEYTAGDHDGVAVVLTASPPLP